MYIYVCVYIYIFIYFLTMQSGQSPILNKPLSSVEKTCHFPAKGPQQRVNLLREAKPRFKKITRTTTKIIVIKIMPTQRIMWKRQTGHKKAEPRRKGQRFTSNKPWQQRQSALFYTFYTKGSQKSS